MNPYIKIECVQHLVNDPLLQFFAITPSEVTLLQQTKVSPIPATV